MKKFLFVLIALLLAAPSMANVIISCDVDTDDVVTVRYDASGETELPRAFALDITVSEGTIDSLSDANDLFWVHPGNIVIDGNEVTSEGSPIAVQDGNFPGREQGGLDTNGITVEMGSLYDPNDATHTVAPDATGTLFKFHVDTEVDSTITIAGNAARGEVVLEDTTQPTVNYGTCEIVKVVECYTGPDYAAWIDVGSPTSWCNPRQCYGDADGIENPVGHGAFWVADPDITILLAGYKQDYSGDPDVDGPDADTNPDAWISADFDHINNPVGHGAFRVADPDITILLYYYKDNHVPPADCLD